VKLPSSLLAARRITLRDRSQPQGIPHGHARGKHTWGSHCQGNGQHQPKQTKTSQPAQQAAPNPHPAHHYPVEAICGSATHACWWPQSTPSNLSIIGQAHVADGLDDRIKLGYVSRWNSGAFGAKTVLVFNLGISEIVVILVVALVFLGPKMLPEIATGLGKVIREIRKATADIRQDIELDDMIRRPLQELRDAATLPPEELKRRDEARAAQRKAAEEEAKRKQQEAKVAEEAKQEAKRKQQEAEAEAERQQRANEELAKAAAALPKPAANPADIVSAGGTMIANPPPSDNINTLTPLPEMHSPPPVVTAQRPRLPPPPPLPRPPSPSAKPAVPADATVIDVKAQLNAAAAARATVTPRPISVSQRSQPIQPQKRPPEGKKD